MRAEDKTQWLICLRVIGNKVPTLLSSRDRCTRCGEAVWRAASSPDNKILCVQCAVKIMEHEAETITVMPPSQRQLRDIFAKRARERN